MRKTGDIYVLYVIDAPAECRTMEQLLQPEGYRMRAFSSAREFLDADCPRHNACLVIDLEISGMNALEFKTALLARGLSIPMIVTTALEELQALDAVRDLGAVAYFRKPVDGHALIDTIRWAFSNGR